MRYILFLLALLVSSFSFAQDSESNDMENIEEVVTSALRRETALQDTGLAITVISASDIESKNLKEFYDFQFNVPGVAFQKSNFSGSAVQMRGMTSYAVGGSFSGIVTYREDDVALGGLQMAMNEIWDVASFEVLRGPQGTLYGGNNPGGTFIINSVDPGEEADGYFKAEFGDLNLERYTGAVTLNPGGALRTRVSFRSTQRDGYVTNEFNGEDIDNRAYLGVRTKTIWDIDDNASVTLTLRHNEENDARLRTQRAACNPNPVLGCDQWGDLPTMGATHTGITAFSAIDYITLNYPGDIVLPDLSLSYTDGADFYEELDRISVQTNPRQIRSDFSASLDYERVLNDTWTMNFIAAYNDQDYDHMQSLNGYVANRNYRMGPIVTDLFNTGMKQYETDESLDASSSVYDDNQYELRFTSDDITAGLYHQLTSSFTNYRVVSPGFQYYSQVSKGPVGNMYPDLGGYGGIGFWATYFGAYGGNLEANIGDAVLAAAIGYVGADPTTPAQIAALIPDLLAAGQCTDPAGDCVVLAQQILVGNAAALPQVLGLGYQNGVMASHDEAATAIRQIAALGANYALAGVPYPVTPALQEWQQQFQSWNKSYWDVWGLFAEWNGELDENTRITAGGRFNFITKKDVVMDGLADISGTLAGYNSTAALAAGQGTLGVGFPVLPEYEEDFNEFTGRVVVDRKLDDGTLVYAKLDRGLKSGGFNPSSTQGADGVSDGAVTLVDPEIHNVFEVGTKGSYLGGSLTLNTAAYYNAISGMQLQKIIGLASQTFNSDVDVMGVEVEALFVPNTWSRFNFVGAYNSSELAGYTDYDPRNPYGASSVSGEVSVLPGGTVVGMTDVGPIYRSLGGMCKAYFNALLGVPCVDEGPIMQDLSGRTLPGVPEISYSMGAEVDFINDERGMLTARLDYIYRGDFYLTVFNNEHEYVEGFDFMNFDLSYTTPDGKWGFDVYVHNLEDKEVITGGFVGSPSNGGGYNLYMQEPMNGGISIIYNF